MSKFDLFSIGHSNIPAERFVAMLRGAGVNAIADVRSTPASRFCPWFSAKNLAPLLAREGISYLFYGKELGGRPRASPITRRWCGKANSRRVSTAWAPMRRAAQSA